MVYEQARVDHGGWTQARQKLANFQLRSEVEFFVWAQSQTFISTS